MQKLSVVIITLNEEKNLNRCLESVKNIADEIVVIDSFSTDETKKIALQHGARFIQHKFEDYVAQHRFADKQAENDFIFSIDADEVVSPSLEQSILEVKKNRLYDGYYLNRLTNYCGSWIKHCGWYPDRKLRLYDRTKGDWQGIKIHESFQLNKDATEGKLKGDLLHFSYYSKDQHHRQVEKFTTLVAEADFERGKKAPLFKVWLSPVVKFIRDYFILLGFLDGKAGFTVCWISAGATRKKYSKLRRLYRKKSRKTTPVPNTIIISRTDSIGDVVLTLPMAGVLKELFPKVKIIFFGRTYTKDIIACSEHIDTFVNWDTIENLPDETKKIERLKSLKADVIIHVFPRSEIARLAKKAGIKTRIGTTGRVYHLTTCNYPVRFTRRRSELHEAQLNLKLLKPFGYNTIPELKELVRYIGFSKIASLEEKFSQLIDPNRISLILHPKSKGSAREWGLENFNALMKLLPDNRYQIFLSGTEAEGKLFREKLNIKQYNVTDISGTMSLKQFIAFIARCDGLVAASTGPLHIAAATGIVALGIFPPIKPMHPGRWAPIGDKAGFLVKETECNDCRKGGSCHCMLEISAEQVKQKLEEYFETR